MTARWAMTSGRALSASRGGAITANGATSLAVDQDGRLIVSAVLREDVTLDCLELPRVGETDLLLAAFEPDGRVAWARRFGAAGQDIRGAFIGLDSAGNVFLLGHATNATAIDLGLGPAPGALFIASYDRDGQARFARGYSGGLDVSQAAVSPSGDLTAIATLQGDVTLDGVVLHGGIDNTAAAVVASWDANGALRFARATFDGPRYNTVTYDPGGRLALSRYGGDVDRPASSIDFLDASGAVTRTIDGGGLGIRTLAFAGNELVAGLQGGAKGLDWIGAYDPGEGELLWQDDLTDWNGAPREWPPYAEIVVDGGERVLSASPLLGTADFGQGPVASHGGFDAVIAAHDMAGQLMAFRQIGGADDETVRGLRPASLGHVAVVVQSTRPVDLGFGAVGADCNGPCDQLTVGVIGF